MSPAHAGHQRAPIAPPPAHPPRGAGARAAARADGNRESHALRCAPRTMMAPGVVLAELGACRRPGGRGARGMSTTRAVATPSKPPAAHTASRSKVELIKEDDGSHGIVMPSESHTLGALVQTILYSAGPPKLVDDVRFTVGHPLQPTMHVRFWSSTPPKDVLAACVKEALALCESILRSV